MDDAKSTVLWVKLDILYLLHLAMDKEVNEICFTVVKDFVGILTSVKMNTQNTQTIQLTFISSVIHVTSSNCQNDFPENILENEF